jgi:hypothetical protein
MNPRESHIAARKNWRRRTITHEISKSDVFTKMILPTSIRHVIPARTRKRTSDVVYIQPATPPPPAISRAHVDYNYLQVITTHTAVFQWALTAVRPLYSAKLVFPFPVEESRTEIAKARGRREKGGTSGDHWLVLDPTSSPASHPLSTLPLHPRSLPRYPRVRGRVYFCNLLEDRQSLTRVITTVVRCKNVRSSLFSFHPSKI